VFARLRGWRERRRQAVTECRAWAEGQVAQERYRYKGPGAPGA